MLASYYVCSQKEEYFAWGRQQQNFWIMITSSRLFYKLELHGAKHFNGNFEVLWKMNRVKMTYFTPTSETDNFRRIIFIMKVLTWNWLKWRRTSVPKECCDYFSRPSDVYEASLEWSPWTSRQCCRNLSDKLQWVFL